jgi:hypothetical protein
MKANDETGNGGNYMTKKSNIVRFSNESNLHVFNQKYKQYHRYSVDGEKVIKILLEV